MSKLSISIKSIGTAFWSITLFLLLIVLPKAKVKLQVQDHQLEVDLKILAEKHQKSTFHLETKHLISREITSLVQKKKKENGGDSLQPYGQNTEKPYIKLE